METETQPLPCPFCGRSPERAHRPSTWTASGEIHFIFCLCGGHSARAHQFGDRAADALKAWNTRAPSIS